MNIRLVLCSIAFALVIFAPFRISSRESRREEREE